uniref:Uncharacterized protein n=1 Tax=Coccolithus braarudii TaxID=221442 RepID=A0A7S0Q879_9EUKA|mmetsp:Transcript_45391/g.96579  ORF Transcript_45391/g.96579 Transcript_45391/m.96579 type:complete len:326 (+) Transcript_45391:3-980(+)
MSGGEPFSCPFQNVLLGHTSTNELLQAAAQAASDAFGVRLGKHFSAIAAMSDVDTDMLRGGCRWLLFACSDALSDSEAARMCQPASARGFKTIRWQPIKDLLREIQPAQRPHFESLQNWLAPILAQRTAAAAAIDFSGRWTRDNSRSTGLLDAFVARGHSASSAAAASAEPYIVEWARHEASDAQPGEWVVRPYAVDGVTLRRTVVYVMGDWSEEYVGASVIFGYAQNTQVLARRTAWMPISDADVQEGFAVSADAPAGLLSVSQMAHTTWTSVGDVIGEVTARYLRGGDMIVLRTLVLQPSERNATLVKSVEVFQKRECATASG